MKCFTQRLFKYSFQAAILWPVLIFQNFSEINVQVFFNGKWHLALKMIWVFVKTKVYLSLTAVVYYSVPASRIVDVSYNLLCMLAYVSDIVLVFDTDFVS